MKEFYESFKKSRWFPLVVGILSIIFGVICVMNPEGEMQGIALNLGFAFLFYGLIHVVAGLLARGNKTLRMLHILIGAVVILLAVLVFVNLEMIGKYLPALAGFFMILSAISDLLHSVVLLKNGEKMWWIGALLAAVVLVLGFVFLLNPGYVGQTFGIFAGIALIVNGLSNLIGFLSFKK